MTSAMSPLDFIVIGGTKCGTTSLYGWMEAHDGVALVPKEQRMFLGEGGVRPAAPSASSDRHDEAKRTGEFANGYTRDPVYPSPAAAVARAFPDVRLLYLIRDPLRRIESHYRHRLVTGREWRSPSDALTGDPGYLAASCYGHQLAIWRDHFPAEQILVIESETLFAEPADTLARICRHLDIAIADHPLPRENAARARQVMPRPLRQLGRFPALHAPLRRLAALRQTATRRGATADAPSFEVRGQVANKVVDTLEQDRDTLARLLPGPPPSWTLSADRLSRPSQRRSAQ